MLLRIEIFPPPSKSSSNADDGDTPQPSQTLYASPATVANRASNNEGGTAGLVATIGRKGDVDILFGADRSISRQHALLRIVARRPGVPKRKTTRRTTRGKKASDGGNTSDSSDETGSGGWFTEPRNEGETAACDDSPYGMCLVLENKGKSGSYVASRDESVEANGGKKDNGQKDAAYDSDATTDDEGAAARGSSNSSEGNFYGTATSCVTQEGEVLVSRSQLSSSQNLPKLSIAVQHHFGSDTPVQLTKLDVDESKVLDFDAGEHETNEDSQNKESSSSSILIQFGCADVPTIKVTRIPMNVVFSAGVSLPIQSSLRLCGGLVQENVRSSSSGPGLGTTHLVTPERSPVAKQLIAWCHGVPIVSPDFLGALRNHANLKDPLPAPSDFSPPALDSKSFWESAPDPHLLSTYIMVSVDPSLDIEQAEALAEAAGATVERLYDKPRKHTKAKISSFLKRVKSLQEASMHATSSPQQVVLLSSTTKSKSWNAHTTSLLKKLREELLIPDVGSKILAKTISQQERTIIGFEPNQANEKVDVATDETAVPKDTDGFPAEKVEIDGEHSDPPDSPDWQLRKNNAPNRKRELEEKPVSDIESPSVSGASENHSKSKGMDVEDDEREQLPSESNKRRRLDQSHQQPTEPPNNGQPEVSVKDKVDARSTRKKKSNVGDTNKPNRLEGKNAGGWFTVAPKDNGERSKWRQRASEAYRKKTGISIEPSASTSGELVIEVASVDATVSKGRRELSESSANAGVNQRRIDPKLPNFKKFRKNSISAIEPGEKVVLLDMAPTKGGHEPVELSAEEQALREDQQLAEALFRGDPVEGMGKKKKRTRK